MLSASLCAAEVRIGFVETAEPGFFAQTVMPTLTSVAARRPSDSVTSVRLTSALAVSEIRQMKPDIVILPSSIYVTAAVDIGAHAVATRKTVYARDPNFAAGAAIVVKASREDLQTLDDLRHRSVAADSPDSIGGWLAVAMELHDAGLSPREFFGERHFLGFAMPDVIMSVIEGRADVGILPACLLERAETAGLIEPGLLRVVHAKTNDALACRHSTALYPDIAVATFPWTDPAVTKDVTLVLLSLPESESYIWQVAGSFQNVTNLFRSLHLGPWAYLDSLTPADIWRRFGTYITGVLLLLAFLLVNELRLRQLVRRRTAALTRALEERSAMEKREEAARAKLARLERAGAVSQLCAMIAHELKQPLNSVVNYMAILKIRLEGGADGAETLDPIVAKAIRGAEEESERMAAIVNRVRGYARREADRSTPVRLDEAAERAFTYYSRHAAGTSRLSIGFEVGKPEATVIGNRLELELLVINLLKNADQAAGDKDGSGGKVRLTLDETAEGWQLAVTDNGPALSDEAFSRLRSICDSVKDDGLGLGLAIVRNIVDEHGARMTIERLTPCGLAVRVTFDKTDKMTESGTTAHHDSSEHPS